MYYVCIYVCTYVSSSSSVLPPESVEDLRLALNASGA